MDDQDYPVTIYTTRLCGFCHAAKRFFMQQGIPFNEVPADGNAQLREELRERTGQHTVPQIWINDHHIGGFTDLMELERQGGLQDLLKQ